MKTTLIAVGKARAPFAEADGHYRRLLDRYQPVDAVEVRDAEEMMRKLPSGARVVALDRDGVALDSLGWSRWLEERRLEARDVCFLIGGPEGLSAEALGAAAESISFGPATLAHQLARVVLLEQLYRAARILAGEPYHR